MPITYLTFIIGALALAAVPPFAGFYSKDAIIEAVHLSVTPGAHYAYLCVLAGAFVTPLYIFRALFLTFHGKKRYASSVAESPWVVLMPLLALALPSLIAGGILIGPMLYATPRLLGASIFILPQHDVLTTLAHEYKGAELMALQATQTLTFWLALAGIITAWLFNLARPQWADFFKKWLAWLYKILLAKYGFDDFNQIVFVRGSRRIGEFFYKVSDLVMIDGIFVNGSGKLIQLLARMGRKIQTGYLYHYALAMLLGLAVLLGWLIYGV